MRKKLLVAAAFAVLTAGAAQAADIPANDKDIAYCGRISWKNPQSPAFTYPGVSAELNFEGTEISMKAKPGSGYFMVEIDDELPYKIHFADNDSVMKLAEGLPQGKHRVKVVYAVEGYNLKPEFRGFVTDGRLLPPPAQSSRTIEFIGNSITCGYGIEAESKDEDFSYATENHYYSYAAQTARALGARYYTVARSGYGMYRNYGGPVEGSKDCIPALYDRTLFYDADEKWDFSLFQPGVVCVNLGTNDTSLNNYDAELLEEASRDFLKRLRGYYPDAKIVMLTGCLLTGKRLEAVTTVLDKVVAEAKAAGDNEVYRFDMSPHTGSLGYGADWHPSWRQSNKMAAELTGFLRQITGWE